MALINDCAHDAFRVYATNTNVFDDHYTEAGYCPTCQRWLVLTMFFGPVHDQFDERAMTDAEAAHFRTIHDHYGDELPHAD